VAITYLLCRVLGLMACIDIHSCGQRAPVEDSGALVGRVAFALTVRGRRDA
jgi:hypothetical protein